MTIALLIHGQGPVALALEAMLLSQGWDAPIQRPMRQAHANPALATRAIALSAGSLRMLQQCISELPHGADIRSVEVQVEGRSKLRCAIDPVDPIRSFEPTPNRGQQDRPLGRFGATRGNLRLLAGDLQVERLGRVVFWGELLRALGSASSRWIEPSSRTPAALGAVDPVWTIQVEADGDPGEDAAVEDSGQSAIVAAVRCTNPPVAWALESFRTEGPLALLPDPRPGHLQLVWCAPHKRSAERLQRSQVDPDSVLHELAQALPERLAPVAWAGPLNTVELRRRARKRLVHHEEAKRLSRVWIGNAAQILHPVAGQGLNLGLRDAATLARSLIDLLALLRSCPRGDAVRAALDAYAAQREADRAIMLGLTDRLASATTGRIFQTLAPLGLRLLHELSPAKRRAARLFAFGPGAIL